MNIVFFLICSLSIVFFGVFLVECSHPVRKSRTAPGVRKSTEAAVVDSATGRRFLVHLEQQMAEFLSHHGRTTTVLLIALVLMPCTLRAQSARSATEPADDLGFRTSAHSVSSEPEQNSDKESRSTQTSSNSPSDSKPTGVNDPAGGTDATALSNSRLHGNFFRRLGQAYMQRFEVSLCRS